MTARCGSPLWRESSASAPAKWARTPSSERRRALFDRWLEELFVDPTCSLRDLTLTAVIGLGDDVLIGYSGGHGSWFTGDPDDRGAPHVTEGLHDVAGQLLLPDLVRDRDAMALLQRWRDQGARVTSVVPRDAGVVVLADRRRRTTVVAAFRGWDGSVAFP